MRPPRRKIPESIRLTRIRSVAALMEAGLPEHEIRSRLSLTVEACESLMRKVRRHQEAQA